MLESLASPWVALIEDVVLLGVIVVNIRLTLQLRSVRRNAQAYLQSAARWHDAAQAEMAAWQRTHQVTRELESRLRQTLDNVSETREPMQ